VSDYTEETDPESNEEAIEARLYEIQDAIEAAELTDAEREYLEDRFNTIATDIMMNISGYSVMSIETLPTASGTIDFYVCIDDKWTLLTTEQEMTGYYISSGSSYYLSAEQLEEIYGNFGFKKDQLMKDGPRYFPHTDRGSTYIYADRGAVELNGTVYSPILRGNVNCDVYYLPNAAGGDYSGDKSTYESDNSFYTITVSDPYKQVYTSETLPVKYVLTGTDATVTVNNGDNVTWQCIGSDGETLADIESEKNENDNTTTFRIKRVSQSYTFTPEVGDGNVIIQYDTNLPGTPDDAEYDTPWIEGSDTYTVLVNITNDSSVHTVLALSQDSYFYRDNIYLEKAIFKGWSVNGDTKKLYDSGASLDLQSYSGKTVILKAQWDTKTHGQKSSMVNFFVSLSAVPEGTTKWTGSIDTGDFTNSVYSTDIGVAGSDAVDAGAYVSTSNTQYFVVGGTSGENLRTAHSTLKERLTAENGYNNNGKWTVSYKVDFPTDEEVLRNIRSTLTNDSKTIQINGQTISVEDLTTKNFTIRWYVFKYAQVDGWHIDGILVVKTGKMIVTKTFAGDTSVIENIIDKGYSISITGANEDVNSESTDIVHANYSLEIDKDKLDSTNTYTWEVDVDQYYSYDITENCYQMTEDQMTTTARYSVSNSDITRENTNGWQSYNGGAVTVTGQGYNEKDTERLTVSFLNTYTKPGTLILHKVDSETGNSIAGVTFKIECEGKTFTDLENSHYSADPNDSSKGTPTSSITTDYSGQAYLWIGGGTYTLTETKPPDGYQAPGVISVELKPDAEETYKVVGIGTIKVDNENIEDRDINAVAKGDNNLELIIKNTSRTVDLVIEKKWEDKETKPVTIQLYRNGKPLENYKVNMDGSTGWEKTFENLPLYADGELAKYTIRETAIGDFKYSDTYSDGYRYYNVTYQNAAYYDENGNLMTDMSDMSQVKTIKLSVTNKKSTNELFIKKVDDNGNPLGGAEFYLYAVPENDQPASYTVIKDDDGNYLNSSDGTINLVKTAQSDEKGTVNFGVMQEGEYYLIEHKAPDGYAGTSDLYRLSLTSDKEIMMYRWDGSTWQKCSSNQVVNLKIVTPTGLFTDRLPYLLMVSLATLALMGHTLSAYRRRKHDSE
jgi:hypothetical protein